MTRRTFGRAAVALALLFGACGGEEPSMDGAVGVDAGEARPPSPVINLVALAGDGTVTLSWIEPDRADLVEVAIAWAPEGGEAAVEPGVARHTVTGLRNGTTYELSAVAVYEGGARAEPATVSATPLDAVGPAPVRDLALEPGHGQVAVRWVDPPDEDLDHIAVSWTPGGETPTEVAPGEQRVVATGLASYLEHTFEVVAVDGAGNRSPAFTGRATPREAPTAPVLAAEDDSGASDRDGVTNVNIGLTFRGSGVDAGRTVELWADGTTLLGSGTADDAGAWTIDTTEALADGTWAVTARSVGADVPPGVESEPTTLVVDTEAPAEPPRLLHPVVGTNTNTELRPRFTWAPLPEGTRVDLQAATDPGFASPEYDWTALSGTEHRPATDLAVSTTPPVGTRYYLRIRAIDLAGNVGPWSDDDPAPPHRYVNVGRFDHDFNGDGYADVLIGAKGRQQAFLYLGNAAADFPKRTGSATQAPAAWEEDDFTFFSENPGFANTSFGNLVTSAGDVDGDGFQDILITDAEYQGNSRREAYLYLGGTRFDTPGSLAYTDADLTYRRSGVLFAGDAAGVGDVNADGYDDLLISDPERSQGEAYLYLGGEPPDATADVELPISLGQFYTDFPEGDPDDYLPAEPDIFGQEAAYGAVAGIGDLNGDGFADYAVGAHYDQKGTQRGSVYVYFGEPSPAPSYGTLLVLGRNQGYRVEPAGDFDGDGYSDFMTCASSASPRRVRMFFGDPDGSLSEVAVFSGVHGDEGAIAGGGDIDGDGYDDVVIAEPTWNVDDGRLYGFFGGPGRDTAVDFRIDGIVGERAGSAASLIGDVNADGHVDVAVGGFQFRYFGSDFPDWWGNAVVHTGAVLATGVTVSAGDAVLRVTGKNIYDYVGWSVGGRGVGEG